MNFLAALVVLFGIAAASEDQDVCYNTVVAACDGHREAECNALMGGFKHVETELQSYVNDQLVSSYDYLLLGTHFNTYHKNRPGFHKLFQELSDKTWDKAVELIKHITKRGGKTDFHRRNEIPTEISTRQKPLEVNEIEALSMALDTEKKLAEKAHAIHLKVSHTEHRKDHYDPEIAQFMEEEFLEYQSGSIRKISGYANDLMKLIKNDKPSLSVFLFDEYLQKQ